MYVKVDFSEDCKAHDYDLNRAGTYAIYTKEHWWNKWEQKDSGYADLEWCISTAKKIAKLPIYL